MEWRTRLGNQQNTEAQDQMQPATFGLLSLNIKTLGAVFRKPGMLLLDDRLGKGYELTT